MKRTDSKRTVLMTGEYQRKNGTYCYRYKDGDKWKDIYAQTLRQLREKKKALKEQQAQGVDTSKVRRLNDVFDEWKRTKSNIIRTSTYNNYILLYRLYAQNTIGKSIITDIRKDDVIRCYSRLRTEKGCTINTVDNLHTVVHQVFDFAVEQRYMLYNPSDKCMVDLKKATRSNTIREDSEEDEEIDGKALTIAQEQLLIKFLRSSRTYAHWFPIMGGMLLFGPRFGEMVALQWDDINFEKETIRINKTLVYTKDLKTGHMQMEMHAPKTPAGHRYIKMTKPLKDIFENEKIMRDNRGRPFKASVDGYNDFVFTTRDETPFKETSFNKAIKRIVRDCNIEQMAKKEDNPILLPSFSSHTFRRTFSTRMVEIGLNVKVLQQVLGHQDASTTLNFYSMVQKELKATQTELIDEKYANMFVKEVLQGEE